jgi:hypothetical protein
MKDKPTLSISSLLQPNTRDLQTVLSKVKAIETLNHTIIPLLDPALQKYCQIANLTNGVLVILTANGSVATELRYHVPDLIRKLQKNHALRHIKEVQCKVRPPMQVGVQRGFVPRKAEKVMPLSKESAEILLAMAETIDDEKLREVMISIAGNTKAYTSTTAFFVAVPSF